MKPATGTKKLDPVEGKRNKRCALLFPHHLKRLPRNLRTCLLDDVGQKYSKDQRITSQLSDGFQAWLPVLKGRSYQGDVLSFTCVTNQLSLRLSVRGKKKKKVHQKTTPGTYLRTTPTISRPLSLASPLEPSRCTLKQLRCFLINTVVWEQFTGHFQSVKERRADKFPFEEKLDLTIEYAMNFTFCLSQIIWEERIAAHRKWCRGHTARHSPCPSESPPYMSSVHPAT